MIRRGNLVVVGVVFVIISRWLSGPSFLSARDISEQTIITSNPRPTSEQIQSLLTRTLENQHRDDSALEEFERIERLVSRKPTGNSEITTDRTDRILPSGSGTMKLPLSENGVPVSTEAYHHELEYALNALNLAIHPNERYRQDLVRFEKRRRDRADLLDTAMKAFRMTWVGRETRGSQTLAKFLLEPDPNYKPTSRFAATLEHVRAVLWLNESEAQFARLEGDITSDITFGGGIAGKVYHGGHFMMEQSEVAPGVWLPTVYTWDVDGRKFLFGFGIHERTEATHYHHVGPPSQAIEIIRNELNNPALEIPRP